MMVSMDRAGRVVIPKDVRERLSLVPDTEFSLEVVGDEIRLLARRSANRRVIEVDGWPVIEAPDDQIITDSDVQRWRDADQR